MRVRAASPGRVRGLNGESASVARDATQALGILGIPKCSERDPAGPQERQDLIHPSQVGTQTVIAGVFGLEKIGRSGVEGQQGRCQVLWRRLPGHRAFRGLLD